MIWITWRLEVPNGGGGVIEVRIIWLSASDWLCAYLASSEFDVWYGIDT